MRRLFNTAAKWFGASRPFCRHSLHRPKMRAHFWVMQAVESARIAGEQLRANRTRSFLTGLGVIIGIIALTLMGIAVKGIDTGFDRSMNMLGEDVLYVEQYPWTAIDDF